jgi:steroid 5-alpha reductase family enzyme
MRRHPNHLLRNLLYVSLIILAAMNQHATEHLVRISTELLLTIVQGVTDGMVAHPGAAALLAGAAYIAHQIRTHQPRTARAHA